jgi:hypothetical protein
VTARLEGKGYDGHDDAVEEHVLNKVSELFYMSQKLIHTVKTAKDIVPMMNLSELLNLSIKGGLVPCCVNDDNHFGRAMVNVRSESD